MQDELQPQTSHAAISKMLNELHAAEIHGHLERVARRYARADLLVIDDFAVLTMDAQFCPPTKPL